MGNIHVANGSKRTISVHIDHKPISIPIIDSYSKVGMEPYKIEGGIGTALEQALDEAGLTRVEPEQAVMFEPDLAEDHIFVSVIALDEATPVVLAYNNRLPGPGFSLLLASNGSLQLSRPCGKFWKTKAGLCYEHIVEKPRKSTEEKAGQEHTPA